MLRTYFTKTICFFRRTKYAKFRLDMIVFCLLILTTMAFLRYLNFSVHHITYIQLLFFRRLIENAGKFNLNSIIAFSLIDFTCTFNTQKGVICDTNTENNKIIVAVFTVLIKLFQRPWVSLLQHVVMILRI